MHVLYEVEDASLHSLQSFLPNQYYTLTKIIYKSYIYYLFERFLFVKSI